jgi:polyferredoxin
MRVALLARPCRAALGEARRFARLDGTSTEVLKGPALRDRRRLFDRARHVVQAGFLLSVVAIGWGFVRWVHGLEAGRLVGARPPGVEAFLPIAALLSVRHLATAGEVHPVHPAGLAILLLVVGVSILVKKAFCSWVCPVGTISEILASLSQRLFGRKLRLKRLVDLPLRSVKYLLLAFFVYAVFFQMGPLAVADFLDSPYNRVADVKMLYFFERLSPFALTVLIGLAALSIVVPYSWCRYLCPYGALLGALSLLSPLKVTRHAPSCIDCNLCTKACPSHLPVARLARVRSDECFSCLSCVAACPVPRALRVGILVARVTGHWKSAITDEEYMRRVRTIDSPAYAHDKGRVPSREEWEAAERSAEPVRP